MTTPALALYLATLDTGSFAFTAAGVTPEQARATMQRAWNAHRREYHAAWTWADVADDVNMVGPITAGTAVRDNEVMRLARVPRSHR